MSKENIAILVSALLSGGLFLLIVSLRLDFVFMFVATLPLFSIGLSQNAKMALQAGALATLLVALAISSISAVVVFFTVFVLPCWAFCEMALRNQPVQIHPNITDARLWYPTGLITLHLAVYGCLMLAAITAMFATGESNLPRELSAALEEVMTGLKNDYNFEIKAQPSMLAFMVCAMVIWIWEILLLASAWLVNRSLLKKGISKRPSLMITPYIMPNWLLSLMGICALASLIGGESISFLGKSSLIILFLPYFFQGLAMLHIFSIRFPHRKVLLFFIYASMALLLWPAFAVAGFGLWEHVKTLNKYLSSGGTSSRN